ncbi:MAG: hypothetical protein WCA44_09845 [Acidobacteriaceae bacterium]
MRTLILLALAALLAASSLAGQQAPEMRSVTVAQLEQFLNDESNGWDKPVARQLAEMKLTERLSDAEEARLEKLVPGKQSRLALLALADESAFLDPPASQIPNRPPPSSGEQAALISKTVAYATEVMHLLPNLLAERTTVWFVGTPNTISPDLHTALFQANLRQPRSDGRLATTGTTRAEVFYRGGQEGYVNPADQHVECSYQIGSNAWGEFGDVLGRVADAMTHGTVTWGHWEQSSAGPLAVFAYQADLTYKFPTFCSGQTQLPPVQVHAQGEIAVNPADGSVLRVTEMWSYTVSSIAGWKPFTQEQKTAVEYAAQKIGDRTYLCPRRSTSLSLYPYFPPASGGIMGLIYSSEGLDPMSRFGLAAEPTIENINDITFRDYHLFRATVRILPDGATRAPQPDPETHPQR